MILNEEKKLVKKAQKDQEYFGQIFDEYYSKIFGYVLRRVADIELTKDIVSETFFKALRSIWRFRWKNISISSWLFRIATNEINTFYRKKKVRMDSIENLAGAANSFLKTHSEIENFEAEEALQRHSDFLFFKKKITVLPIHYQEVLTLRFFEDKSIKEICEILGKKEGTVKSLISRGLDKLRAANE